MNKSLNPTGWGYVEDALNERERENLLKVVGQWFGGGASLERRAPPPAESIRLPAPRMSLPQRFGAFMRNDHAARLLHARGRSYRDLAEMRGGELSQVPDLVATPRDRDELAALLEWAQAHRVATIPYGGGSSVVGGINPENLGPDFAASLTLSLRAMNKVLDVDTRSRTVHAEAGILGPDLEEALKPHGLAVRHFPQSYFHSTLGGWAATRGAGHFSTGLAKIEDRVQALGVTLPDGRRMESRRLPASSIGPDPNRLWLGSEGTLGVITDVHLRVVPVPSQRVSAGVRFKTFEKALEAARALLHAGFLPAQMRILDPLEHMLSRAFAGKGASGALMVLAFESGGAPLGETFAGALELARAHGGEVPESAAKGAATGADGAAQGGAKSDAGGSDAQEAVGDWRNAFFRQPYLRDALLDYGVIADTFETAVPWSAVPAFYHAVRDATQKAILSTCGAGVVSCRSTHAYTDGLCLYFAFFGRGRHGSLVQQYWDIRTAAATAVLGNGGTMSHHHAMGRDHARFSKAEVPAAFRAAVRAAKRELDPAGVLNPGLWFTD